MAIDLASIYELTRPGLRAVEGKYKQIPTRWSRYMKSGKSRLGVERTAEARYLPTAQLRQDGGQTYMDNNSGVRYIYNHEHFQVALGYAITLQSIEDNLYETQFPSSNLGLQNSFAQTKEIYCANVLNTANVYNTATGGDGVALCSTAHPYDGGTWANTPTTQVDLTESTLLAGLTQIRSGFRDLAGLRFHCSGRLLIVPPSLEWCASRLINSDLRPGTDMNDVNALRATGSLPDKYEVVEYLTSNYAWFIVTDSEEGLLYLDRAPFEMSMDIDWTTDNLLVKGRERYYTGYSNPRGVYGSFPTA